VAAGRYELASRRRLESLAWLRSPAVEIFVWSRVAIWLGVLLASMWFEPKPPPLARVWDNVRLHDVGHAIDIWARWDSGWLLTIADDGYTANETSTAFYPLYPGLVRVLGRMLGEHYILAGVLISLAAALGAFLLLYRLAETRLGPEGAQRAVLYLAVFPTTLFLQAVYTESLFLLLVLAVFVLAERGRMLSASVAAGLAMLTRAMGVAVLPALAYYAWKAEDRRRALAGVLIAPAMFLVYPLYLWIRLGDPLRFVDAQEEGWGRRTPLLGPLDGVWEGVRRGVPAIPDLFDADAPDNRVVRGLEAWDSPSVNLQALVFLILFVALTVVAYKRLPRPDFLYAATSVLFLVSAPVHPAWPLVGLPRYGLVVFPFFIALAVLGGRRQVHNAILAISSILLGMAVAQWAVFQWVG
jgi:hypothetical protein